MFFVPSYLNLAFLRAAEFLVLGLFPMGHGTIYCILLKIGKAHIEKGLTPMDQVWLVVATIVVVLFLELVAWQAVKILRKGKLKESGGPKPQAKIPDKTDSKPVTKQPPKPLRSEAITLLATLQREARFVDFIKEPLDSYSDAQIGAAVRDVHRDCAKVLDRLFAIRSMVDQEEGSPIEVPSGFDAGRYRLTGNVAGDPPFRGRMVHHGWEAAEVQLPAWSGTQLSARVVAPVEVELA